MRELRSGGRRGHRRQGLPLDPQSAHPKRDPDTGERRLEGNGRAYLESVFVPRTRESDENDGWLLAYVYDAATDGGEVLILHAQDFTGSPVATIQLPQRVPFGFHGNWIPDAN